MTRYLIKLPNWLTSLRIFLIPVFVVLMVDPSDAMVYWATGIFAFAAFTDYVDGYLARRYRAVSNFGKLLDPLADKILVMAALVMLVAQRGDVYGMPWVPAWMVVLVLAREFWVTGLRAVAASQGVIVAASSSGKLKNFLQMVSIVFLLLHDYEIKFGLPLSVLGIGPADGAISCQLIGINLLFISLVFSVWSAGEYSIAVLWQLPESENEPTNL